MTKLRLAGLCFLLLVSLLLASCGGSLRGSGDLETREYTFDDFTKVEIGHAFKVTITQSESYSVNVTVDDNVTHLLDVEKSGDTLKIRLTRTPRLVDVTLQAEVAMPQLHGLTASGASRANVSGFSSTEALSFGVSGASAISGDITAGDARFELSGASTIELEGSAADLVADVSGASHLRLGDFVVTNADLQISGASDSTVNLSGRLDADLSGASKLRYIGEPTIGDVNTGGSSSIQKE
jgi:hypothetical protein